MTLEQILLENGFCKTLTRFYKNKPVLREYTTYIEEDFYNQDFRIEIWHRPSSKYYQVHIVSPYNNFGANYMGILDAKWNSDRVQEKVEEFRTKIEPVLRENGYYGIGERER